MSDKPYKWAMETTYDLHLCCQCKDETTSKVAAARTISRAFDETGLVKAVEKKLNPHPEGPLHCQEWVSSHDASCSCGDVEIEAALTRATEKEADDE